MYYSVPYGAVSTEYHIAVEIILGQRLVPGNFVICKRKTWNVATQATVKATVHVRSEHGFRDRQAAYLYTRTTIYPL